MGVSQIAWSNPAVSDIRPADMTASAFTESANTESAHRESELRASQIHDSEFRESNRAYADPLWSDFRGSLSTISYAAAMPVGSGAAMAQVAAATDPAPPSMDLGRFGRGRLKAGEHLAALPPVYQTLDLGGRTFYTFDGVYYEASSGAGATGYEVVPTPLGLVVRAPPAGAEILRVGDETYYRSEDTYYLESTNGYVVVEAPAGAAAP
jgi:hypothetical protein